MTSTRPGAYLGGTRIPVFDVCEKTAPLTPEMVREALGGGRRRSPLKELLLAMPDAGKDADFVRPKERPRRVRL